MIGNAVQIAQLLVNVISGWFQSRQERTDRIYNAVVKKSYEDLQAIHQDYEVNLAKLRDHLNEQSLPPTELIRWWRATGLQYRKDREALLALEAIITEFRSKIDKRAMDHENHFYRCLIEYVDEILRYYTRARWPYATSLYRYYEQQLEAVLAAAETVQGQSYPEDAGKPLKIPAEVVARKFYESSNVRQISRDLVTFCDKLLPQLWKDVNEKYRRVQAAAGFPA